MKRKTTQKMSDMCTFETLEERQHFSVFTVTSTADDGGNGELRWAIYKVNNDPNPGTDTINFNINYNNSAQQTIKLNPALTALPAITHSVVIDGSSQNSSQLFPIALVGGGLTINAGNSTVKDLSIQYSYGYGRDIALQNNGGDVVQGCELFVPIGGVGVYVYNSSGDDIGQTAMGGTARQGNTIIGGGTSSSGAGIFVDGTSASTLIDGNVESSCGYGLWIGSGAQETSVLASSFDQNASHGVLDYGEASGFSSNCYIRANGGDGILEDGVNANIEGNTIDSNQQNGIELLGPSVFYAGGVEGNSIESNHRNGILVEASQQYITGNTIAYSVGDGVQVTNNARDVYVSQNSIFSNTGVGIDLQQNGNGLAAAPTITSAVASNGKITISGTYHGLPNDFPYFEFFVSAPGRQTDGQTYLGNYPSNDNVTVQTDPSGNLSFSVTFASSVTSGVITATATNGLGDTSAFSAPVNITTPVMKAPLLPGKPVFHV